MKLAVEVRVTNAQLDAIATTLSLRVPANTRHYLLQQRNAAAKEFKRRVREYAETFIVDSVMFHDSLKRQAKYMEADNHGP